MPGLATESTSTDVQSVMVCRYTHTPYQACTQTYHSPSTRLAIARRKRLICIWDTDALAAATSTLSVDAQKRAEKDAAKKAQKAEAAEAKAARTFPLA